MPNMELLLALLGAATLLAVIARRIGVPYPIVLVIGGAVLAAIPGVPEVKIPPNVVFLVFLPPLLYSGSLFISPAELRHNAPGILILAIGLVLATVGLVAVVGHVLVGLPWADAFVLGAILGATDPVAATAIIHRLGAPERIATLLEGEALVNDGTSLTAFKVALVAVGARSFSLGHGILEFLLVSLGGVTIGAAVGAASSWINSRLDDPDLEIAVGLLTAYGAYIAADRAGVSGVLAAVAAGVVTAHRAADIFSPGTRLRSYAFWQTAAFLLNAMLFLLVGLQLRAAAEGIQGTGAGAMAGYSLAIIGTLIALRLAWMFAVPALVPAIRRRLPDGQIRSSWSEQLILGWSGMRGALSLAAALSLPVALGGRASADRGLIVFLSFAAIFVTLVLPGLTLMPLIRVLGVGQSERRVREATEARIHVVRAALRELDQVDESDEHSDRTLARLRDVYETRLDSLERRLSPEPDEDGAPHGPQEQELRRRVIQAQRETLRQLAGKRAAPVEVIREIEHDLDLDSARLTRL
jgi:CPA1 family monovalent cation:H+ antiporter